MQSEAENEIVSVTIVVITHDGNGWYRLTTGVIRYKNINLKISLLVLSSHTVLDLRDHDWTVFESPSLFQFSFFIRDGHITCYVEIISGYIKILDYSLSA